jgi:hypothetical protein
MELSERRPNVFEPGGGPTVDDAAVNQSREAAREAGERFLRAGDRAIDRALSGDSEAFLRASRQEGGE